MNPLAPYLTDQLAQRGWDQKKLAEETGLAESTVSNILNNPHYGGPTRATVGRIARALDIPQRTLLELAGYSIDESGAPEERTTRLARLLTALPRTREITEKLFQLPAEEQDVVLSLIEELHRRHLHPGRQSIRESE